MNLPAAKLLPVLLLLSSCSIPLGKPVASESATESVSAATQAAPVDTAAECSRLRADIASARYSQRNAPPTTSSSVIAAASTAKADQRIDEMQQRLDRLGCARDLPESPDAAVAAPGPRQ